MSISAVNVESVTVNPSKVRYSLTLDHLGNSSRGSLQLQRSDHRKDGTWMDDPKVNSRKTVPLPRGPAVDGIVALLPALLSRLGVTDPFTDYRLQLRGRLSAAGVLNVTIVVQVFTAQWVVKTIPNLAAFLEANPDIAPEVLTAWDTLDSAIDAANQREQWL